MARCQHDKRRYLRECGRRCPDPLTAEQLYNSFDPSPFHERDLDDEAERYIAGWAREIRGTGQLKVMVTLPKGAHNSEGARRIPEAIHNYFSNRTVRQGRSFTSFCALAGVR